MEDMNALQLKTLLVRTGVPVYKNNKICRKDLQDLKFKDSGLEVREFKLLDCRDEPGAFAASWHVAVEGGDSKMIDGIFHKNKRRVEKKLLQYCRQMGFGSVTGVELKMLNRNSGNVWIEAEFKCSLKDAWEREEGCMAPFFHRLFERE
jgi:hypothetical protein